jgi:hypothetical protein
MKKTIILLVFLVNYYTSFAQDTLKIPDLPLNSKGLVEYNEVFEVTGASATQLRNRCKKWFADYYKSSKDVIQSDTEENITGKGIFKSNINLGLMTYKLITTYHTISVDFKEGKYRVRIYNFSYDYSNIATTKTIEDHVQKNKEKGDKAKEDSFYGTAIIAMDYNCKRILKSLQKSMNTTPDKDDW